MAHLDEVFNAGVTQGFNARSKECMCNLGGAKGGLHDGRNRDALNGQSVDQGVGIKLYFFEVDL